MSVRVRFAPSPTGHVHIGNIRAAIFNWLFARHHGGTFVLRVEDTDRERCTPAAIETLLEAMTWLGLNFDEAPLYQTTQVEAHRAAAQRLLATGHAYRHAKGEGAGEAIVFRLPVHGALPCLRVVGPATLTLHPEAPVRCGLGGIAYALVSKKGTPAAAEVAYAGMPDLRLYDAAGKLLFDLAPQLDALLAGAPEVAIAGAVRAEFTRREVFYRDAVKGELAKPLDSMRDQVLVRSDGNPVFHLANVCDDIAQGITHIIRGDDHVENTYRHVLLYHALGATPPQYAHLPMIVNQAGKPYSKRDGDAYVGDFRAKGYLPEALFNYLALLGWSPGDDREMMTRAELVQAFTLERVLSSPAQMDLTKLEHLNGRYLAAWAPADFLAAAKAHAPATDWDAGQFARVAALMQSRTKTWAQVADWVYFFTDAYPVDEKAVQKHLARPEAKAALATLRERLAALATWDLAGIEAAIHATTAAAGIGQGKLNLPIRLAVTGTSIGAGLYETMALLGRDRVLARLARVG